MKQLKKFLKLFLILFLMNFLNPLEKKILAIDLNSGKEIFIKNCNVCHLNGTNVIIPEKNLKNETLETNGMKNLNAIIYQITNGKNGMPAFGRRLNDKQIEEVANYVLEKSSKNFED